MDDVYLWTRLFYFIWAFILFCTMIYYGLIDVMLAKENVKFRKIPENQLFAAACLAQTFVLIMGLGEILLIDVVGGIRVFLPVLFLSLATLGTLRGAERVREERRQIALGE